MCSRHVGHQQAKYSVRRSLCVVAVAVLCAYRRLVNV